MTDLRNQKLDIFKKFIIGEGFSSNCFEWSDFSVERYNDKKIKLVLDVNKSFGHLSTDEEYDYIKAQKKLNLNEEDILSEISIKSKLISSIVFKVVESKLIVTLEINTYSRNVDILKKRNCEKFTLESKYPTEYIESIYDINNSLLENGLLALCGDVKSSLKSVDNKLDLNFFTQLDNMNSRIYLYMYIELMELMCKKNVGFINLESLLSDIRITNSFNIKKIYSKIFNDEISFEEFKLEIEDIAKREEQLRFIPLISLYDINLIIYRRGYYFPESSMYLKEFAQLTALSESEILKHYNLKTYKGYQSLVRKNMENIYLIKYLENEDFKYKDIINILTNLKIDDIRTDNVFETEFIKKYIAINGRKGAVKKLFHQEGCLPIIKDVIKMLDSIMKKDTSELIKNGISKEKITYDNVDKYFNFNCNINNLEMEIIDAYVNIDTPGFDLYYESKDKANSEFFEYNLPNIDYSKSEYLLYKESDYSLYLPLNSQIVKKVGKVLSICVGNYVEKIKNQETVVLFMKKDSRYIGCIELDSKYETLVQAKIRYNKLFNEKEQEFIYNFCKYNEIEICTKDMESQYNTLENYRSNLAI